MKELRNRAIAAVLTLLMLAGLAACNGEDAPVQQNNTPGVTIAPGAIGLGRYAEERIALSGVSFAFPYALAADGLRLHGFQGETPVMVDYLGGSIDIKPITDYQAVESYALLPDGRAAMLAYTEKTQKLHLFVENNGAFERKEYQTPYVSGQRLCALPDGRLAATMPYSPVTLLDANGMVTGILGTSGSSFAAYGDTLYVLEGGEAGYKLFSYDSAGNGPGKEISQVLADYVEQIAVSAAGIYAVALKGVYKLEDSGAWTLVIDALLCSLGDPTLYPTGLIVTDEGAIYVPASANDEGVLLRYTWDESLASRPEETLRVASIEENAYIRAAISAFNSIDPGVYVDYTYYISEAEQMEGGGAVNTKRDDAVRAINTEMLAGSGPDVLLLDGLAYARYAQKGLLLDLTDWFNTHSGQGEWLMDIATSLRSDNGLFCIPLRFRIPALWGAADTLKGLDTLTALADYAEQLNFAALSETDQESFFRLSYIASQPAWTKDGKQDFSDPAFLEFLTAIKRIRDACKHYGLEGPQLLDVYKRNAALYSALIGNAYSAQHGYSFYKAIGENPGVAAFPATGTAAFLPSMIVAVNANSGMRETAFAYLDTLISREMMKIDHYTGVGMPIRMDALESMIVVSEEPTGSSIGFHGMDEGVEILNLDASTRDQLLALFKGLRDPAPEDHALLKMVLEETEPYLSGAKTLEEAANALEARTRSYLAE